MRGATAGNNAKMIQTDLGNRFAVLTAAAKGAIGVLWFAGPNAAGLVAERFRQARGSSIHERADGTFSYGYWRFSSEAGPNCEDVLLVKLGPSEYEVHAHGGGQSREWLRRNLMAEGFVELSLSETLVTQQGSPLRGVIAEWLLRCETERAASWLLKQEAAWIELLSRLQEALRRREGATISREVSAVLERLRFVRHLIEPRLVVLGGAPNVGKSSLINALSGFARAIVHKEPGTTRDVVTQRLVFDGWLVEIADTAGQRAAGEIVEAAGVERAKQIWRQADCRVAVVDATCSERLSIAWEPLPHLFVANKLDLPGAEVQRGELGVSAHTGLGLEGLQAAIVAELTRQNPPETAALPLSPELVQHLTGLAAGAEREAWQECERACDWLARFCRRQ